MCLQIGDGLMFFNYFFWGLIDKLVEHRSAFLSFRWNVYALTLLTKDTFVSEELVTLLQSCSTCSDIKFKCILLVPLLMQVASILSDVSCLRSAILGFTKAFL